MITVNSKLYKRLAKATIPEDHPKLLRELNEAYRYRRRDAQGYAELVYNYGHFDKSARGLTDAFVWALSPQGHDYWQEYSDTLRKAGWEDVS